MPPQKLPSFLTSAKHLAPLTAAPAIAGQEPVEIQFPGKYQEASNWCWAAAAIGVFDYYAGIGPLGDKPPPSTQCALATKVKNVICCPALPKDYEKDWVGNTDFALADVLRKYGYLERMAGADFSLQTLAEELANRRPVCCAIDIFGSPIDHFVVLCGVDIAKNEVWVRDPDKVGLVNGYVPLDKFRTYNSHGEWYQTYFTKAPA